METVILVILGIALGWLLGKISSHRPAAKPPLDPVIEKATMVVEMATDKHIKRAKRNEEYAAAIFLGDLQNEILRDLKKL
jgi:hypothetical protein